jgi:thiol-disulfide isomerase/thioredoxin
MFKPSVLSLVVLAAFALQSQAAAPAPVAVTLKPGDPAPKLQLDKWLKGEPIKSFEKDKIYVIECWATWCGPCIASMPHVTRMQAKFKDKGVVVIGVNVWERDLSAPEPFVKKMGDKMGYAVATDVLPVTDDGSTGPGAMATTWLQAAGRNGIPCSFIVDRQGKIAWIGHPMQMERPLALIADNKFDLAEEAKFTEQMDKLSADFGAALKASDNDKALATLDQIAVLNPSLASQYGTTRLMVLMKKGDYAAANTLAAKLADDVDASPASLAATMLNAPDVDKIDGALAVKLAIKAYEGNDKTGWQYEGLLAKAYAANKQYDKAVEFQTKDVASAPAQVKDHEQKTLDEYTQKAAEKK